MKWVACAAHANSARATASLMHFLPCGQTVQSLSPALHASLTQEPA